MLFDSMFERRLEFDNDVINELIDYTHNNPDKGEILRHLLDIGQITLKEYLYAANRKRIEINN